VTSSVATFEESPPAVADWRQKLDVLAGLGLPFLVASEAGAVVGFAYAAPWRPRPAYRHTVEDTVYLDPGRTGRGIGRALLGALLAACAQAGVRQVIAVIATPGDTSGTATPAGPAATPAGPPRSPCTGLPASPTPAGSPPSAASSAAGWTPS
jgi:L-amino acid N-acyltransferase YncA